MLDTDDFGTKFETAFAKAADQPSFMVIIMVITALGVFFTLMVLYKIIRRSSDDWEFPDLLFFPGIMLSSLGIWAGPLMFGHSFGRGQSNASIFLISAFLLRFVYLKLFPEKVTE